MLCLLALGLCWLIMWYLDTSSLQIAFLYNLTVAANPVYFVGHIFGDWVFMSEQILLKCPLKAHVGCFLYFYQAQVLTCSESRSFRFKWPTLLLTTYYH